MSIPEAEPHIAALKTVLEAALTFPVGLAHKPDGAATPYVVLYPDPAAATSASLCDDRETLTLFTIVHGIGEGPEQAIWALDQTRTALLTQTPTVTGRAIRRMWQTTNPAPARRDDDVSPPLWITVAEFGMRSSPA